MPIVRCSRPPPGAAWILHVVLLAAAAASLPCVAVEAQILDRAAWPNTDFERHTVPLEEIMPGGPPKDGIPPIDEPRFVGVEAAGEWIDAREPVIVLSAEGETKAYPLQILTWHEIVNDTIAGRPVAVTFCPLCNASIVFDRRLGHRVLDFGTTGKLRKSDLVMWDRQTESWWQQFTGKAIVGELAGATLERIPAALVAFEDLRAAYPNAAVLSRDTGHRRPYGQNPYRGYDSTTDQPFLFRDPVDPRLPPMERVLAVSHQGRYKLYPLSALEEETVLNDEVAGLAVVVLSRGGMLSVLDQGQIAASRRVPAAVAYDRRLDGRVLEFERRGARVVDTQSASTWDLFGTALDGPLRGRRLRQADEGVHFAFAWLAFRPDSTVHGRDP